MGAPTELSGANWAVKINGKDLHEYGVLSYGVNHLNAPSVALRQAITPRAHGASGKGGQYSPMPLIVSGKMFANSAALLRASIDDLKVEVSSLRGKFFDELAPIRLETADLTDRYIPCVYVGELTLPPLGSLPTTGALVDFQLPLLRLLPYSKANQITEYNPSGTGPVFQVIGTGTAPCPCVIELEGSAIAPAISLANMSFYADFERDLVATILTGGTLTGSSGASNLGPQFEPGDWGSRYYQQSTFTTSWASFVNNPDECTIIMAIRPQFDYAGADATMLEHYIDADNGIRLKWSNSSAKWILEKEDATTTTTITPGTVSTHASNDLIILAASQGPAGMELYVNGVSIGSSETSAAKSGITGSSGTLYLGDQGASARPNCKYMRLMIFPFQLSDDEIRRYSLNIEEQRPANVQKSTSATIATNARVVLDFENHQATLYAADGAASNDTGNWDTNGWPLLHPNQTCLYIPSGKTINDVNTRHRNRYL